MKGKQAPRRKASGIGRLGLAMLHCPGIFDRNPQYGHGCPTCPTHRGGQPLAKGVPLTLPYPNPFLEGG